MVSNSSDVSCPTEGELRAHQDEPDGGIAVHVGGCDMCARRSDDLRAGAQVAARAIAGLDDGVTSVVDAEAVLAARLGAAGHGGRLARWSRVPAGVSAAVVVLAITVLLVVTPGGRRAAAGFLEQFRAERFTVVTFDPSAAVDELAAIAEIDVEEPEAVVADDIDDAGEIAGFTPTPVATLPDGAEVTHIAASSPTTVRLTFDADHAPDLPSDLDGARVIISVPGSVVTQYTHGEDELLFVAEAGQLVAEAEGGELAAIREYVLSRPEVSEDVARQLLAIDDWATTVPIPVPVDALAWRDTTVAGQPALMIEDPMGAGLLWQGDGRMHAVGGTATDLDHLRAIADGVGG
jgi:hypothetical protein